LNRNRQTDGQKGGQTDGHGYIDSARRPDKEYVYFMEVVVGNDHFLNLLGQNGRSERSSM